MPVSKNGSVISCVPLSFVNVSLSGGADWIVEKPARKRSAERAEKTILPVLRVSAVRRVKLCCHSPMYLLCLIVINLVVPS